MDTDNNKTSAVVTKTTALLSQSLAPQELDKHRAWIGVRIEVMLHGYWKDTPSGLVKDGIMRQWMNALHNFTQEEIDKACSEYVLSNPRRKPNEGHIRELIMQNKRGGKYALPPSVGRNFTEERIQATAEQRQAITEDVNFSGVVQVKSFNSPPKEKE